MQVNLNWRGRLHARATRLGTALTAPLRRSGVSLDRPVFVWANGQSGTFILYDLLATSGHFVFPFTRGPRKKGLATQRYRAHHVAFDRKPVEGQVRCWRGAGLVFERSEGWIFDQDMSAAQAERVDAGLVRSRYRKLSEDWVWRAASPRRLLDKSTNYLFMLAAIDRVFPDAQHIFMWRDPRLILSSILRRFKQTDYEEGFGGFASGFYGNILLPGWQDRLGQSLDARHAWQVTECLGIGRRWADRLGERCRVLSHEGLCADPVGVMLDLAAWLGITYDVDALRHAATGVAPVAEKAWPQTAQDPAIGELFLDPESLGDMAALQQLAIDLGYDAQFCGRVPAASFQEI